MEWYSVLIRIIKKSPTEFIEKESFHKVLMDVRSYSERKCVSVKGQQLSTEV